jgi:hypothetical protein
VVEKFAEYVEVIIPAPNLEPVQSHGEIDCFRQWPPNNSLKRASSRTKSSNRRLAAVSSRKANQVSALADSAHNKSEMRQVATFGKGADDVRHARGPMIFMALNAVASA